MSDNYHDGLSPDEWREWQEKRPMIDVDDDPAPAPEDMKLVDCARCGRELLGESQEGWYSCLQLSRRESLPPLIYRRIYGRPYCRGCSPLKSGRK